MIRVLLDQIVAKFPWYWRFAEWRASNPSHVDGIVLGSDVPVNAAAAFPSLDPEDLDSNSDSDLDVDAVGEDDDSADDEALDDEVRAGLVRVVSHPFLTRCPSLSSLSPRSESSPAALHACLSSDDVSLFSRRALDDEGDESDIKVKPARRKPLTPASKKTAPARTPSSSAKGPAKKASLIADQHADMLKNREAMHTASLDAKVRTHELTEQQETVRSEARAAYCKAKLDACVERDRVKAAAQRDMLILQQNQRVLDMVDAGKIRSEESPRSCSLSQPVLRHSQHLRRPLRPLFTREGSRTSALILSLRRIRCPSRRLHPQPLPPRAPA